MPANDLLQGNNVVPVLAMRDVSYSYGNRKVLYDVNLTLHKGQLLGLIGPNGSGKTTLLKIALGIIRPHRGRVYWFGQDNTGRGPGPQVGYVPQNLQTFTPDFPATAAEVVATGLVRTSGLGGWWSRRDREAVEAALALVGLSPMADYRVSRMSGGERQRVFIARALVNRPQVLLLDEPTASIDVDAQQSFYDLLGRLHREHGLTILLVSHDIGMVTRKVTHLACLNRTMHYHGDIQGFLQDPDLSAVYGRDMAWVVHHHHEEPAPEGAGG